MTQTSLSDLSLTDHHHVVNQTLDMSSSVEFIQYHQTHARVNCQDVSLF